MFEKMMLEMGERPMYAFDTPGFESRSIRKECPI